MTVVFEVAAASVKSSLPGEWDNGCEFFGMLTYENKTTLQRLDDASASLVHSPTLQKFEFGLSNMFFHILNYFVLQFFMSSKSDSIVQTLYVPQLIRAMIEVGLAKFTIIYWNSLSDNHTFTLVFVLCFSLCAFYVDFDMAFALALAFAFVFVVVFVVVVVVVVVVVLLIIMNVFLFFFVLRFCS